MATKYLTQPVIWKAYTDDSFFSEVGLPREPFIDKRDGTPRLRIFDAVTPGGKPIGNAIFSQIMQPTILGPLHNATGISVTPILTASPYNSSSLVTHPHGTTRWQVATDAAFTNVVYDSGETAVNLESIDLLAVGAIALTGGEIHYVRVRYTSTTDIASEWSPIISFTTLDSVVVPSEYINETTKFYDIPAGGNVIASSLDGTTVVVGADQASGVNVNGFTVEVGVAYIFVKNGSNWSKQVKLMASDPNTNDGFGNAVAISDDGNTVAIAAHYNEPTGQANTHNSGSVYIFTRSGVVWTQQTKIEHGINVGKNFGSDIAISSDGNTLLIGAPQPNSANPGKAYVYTRSGTIWTLLATITQTDTTEWNGFADKVAISADGNTFLIGAGFNKIGANYSPAAYVFIRSGSTVTQQSKLLPTDVVSTYSHNLPMALSADGLTASLFVDGSVHAYVKSGTTWTRQSKIAITVPVYELKLSSDGNKLAVGTSNQIDAEGSVYIYSRSGTVWVLSNKLKPTQLEAAGNPIGRSIDITADCGKVFAGSANTTNPTLAAFYVFDIPNVSAPPEFENITKLMASDGAAGDRFGSSIALSTDGNTAIIGAYMDEDQGDSTPKGAAYIFIYTGTSWSQQAKIAPAGLIYGDRFGWSVAMSNDGNTVAISAVQDSIVSRNRGAVYIFTRSGVTWTQQAKLNPTSTGTVYKFGSYLAISGDGNTLAIGSNNSNEAGSGSGAAYIFTRSGTSWTQQAKLLANDLATNFTFGSSVAITDDGNMAAIGASGVDSNKGAIYIFTRSGTTWTQQGKLLASDGEVQEFLGVSVDISSDGSTLIAGSFYDDDMGTTSGSAYVFTRSGTVWTQQAKLLDVGGVANDRFGWSVAISNDGNTAFISSAKGVFMYERTGSTWNQSSKPSSHGTSGFVNGNIAVTSPLDLLFVGYVYDTGNQGAVYIYD